MKDQIYYFDTSRAVAIFLSYVLVLKVSIKCRFYMPSIYENVLFAPFFFLFFTAFMSSVLGINFRKISRAFAIRYLGS